MLLKVNTRLGNGQVAILEESALNFEIGVGDTVDLSYSFPLPRETGEVATVGVSERRINGRFTVSSIVRQDGVTLIAVCAPASSCTWMMRKYG